VHLVDHPERDRLDGRPGEPAEDGGDLRLRVRASIAIAVIVLMMDSASAPLSAQARASATMSDVLGSA
jgi:hypothetical protein